MMFNQYTLMLIISSSARAVKGGANYAGRKWSLEKLGTEVGHAFVAFMDSSEKKIASS